MTENHIVFTAFDDRQGPVPVFTTLDNHELASKIAVKSIVSTLSARDDQQKIEGEAIIPFPEENLLAFIYYVSLDQKTKTGDFRTISLSFLTTTENSNELYSNAADLSISAKEIGKAINEQFVFGETLPVLLQSKIRYWGQKDENPVDLVSKKERTKADGRKLSLYDLFNLFPPETGFRKYEDPLSSLILAFLYNIPVVLSGPDTRLLTDVTEILQQIYPIKKLSVINQDQIKDNLDINSTNPQNIPKADIIVLTDDFYKKCFFSRDPIVILTVYQELLIPYHKFDEKDIKKITVWLKTCRDKTDISEIVIELKAIQDKLDQLLYLASSNRESTMKEIMPLVDLEKTEVEFLSRILVNSQKATAAQLNKLLSVDHFKDIEILMRDSIGMITL